MPRTLSGPERTKSQATQVRHVLRAEVMDVDGSWQDLRDLGTDGINILVGGQITTTVDDLTWRATVRVRLGADTEGASPLLGASLLNRASGVYSPLLTPGAQIRLYADTLGTGESESDTTKRLMFWGRIDRSDFASNPMTLTCRDLGGILLDTIVRVDRTYGDKDSPVPAADVMQQFLNDNADLIGGTAPTLYVADTSTYVVTEFRQVGVSILDALNTLADLFGFRVRYTFDPSDNFVLTLYDPQRDRVIPSGGDYTIAPTEYHEVPQASLDITNVRNHLLGWYVDGVTGEALSVEVSDAGSIAAFGDRFEQFGGDAVANIRDGNTMLTFLQFALADQASPPFDHEVKALFLHFVALGDVPEFSGNAVHYDDPQQLAVVGITHDFPDSGNGAATTSLPCRGSPSGAYKRWLRYRGGPVFPQIPPATVLNWLVAEGTQYGGTSATVDGALWLGYTLPPGVDEMRIHVLLGDGPNLGVPSIIDPTTWAVTIRRPEGDIGKSASYGSIAILSTDENYYKRIAMYSVRGGLTSQPVIAPTTGAMQAVDPVPTPADGTVASLSVVRDGSTNTVTVTPGTLEPTLGFNYVCIIRNKHILPPIPIGTSTAAVVFVDSGLDPSAASTYAYEAFIGNFQQGANGWFVSGGKRLTVVEAPTLQPPLFANGTPIATVVGFVPEVQIDWTGATAGASGVRVEASIDGVSVRVVGSGLLASGTVYDPVTGPKLYRLVATSLIPLGDVVAGPWTWYTGLNNPLSNPGTSPSFTNGTPKIVFGSTFPTPTLKLGFEWADPVSPTLAPQLVIQRSTTGTGGPWVDILVTAASASGSWQDPDSANVGIEAWYRMIVRQLPGLGGATVATSAVSHYVPPT